MNDHPKTESSPRERSTFVRFFRWLFSWRGIRRVLIVTAWIVTIIGLWYGEENWRGRRAWNQYRKATAARGVSLDFSAYVPKPVPDDQNFAATPFLKSLFQTNVINWPILTNDLYFRASDHIWKTNITKDRGERHFADLVAWQMASIALQKGKLDRNQNFETDKTDPAARAAAAPAVLEGMKPDAELFAELRSASSREYARFPVIYDVENLWGISLWHLGPIKMLCQRLSLQACAELAAGQIGQAATDVKLILSLADSIKSEPFLVSLLVRGDCVQMAAQPVWEGLAERQWTDSQLQELQARFLSYAFLNDMDRPLNAERAAGLRMIDLVKMQGGGFFADVFPGDAPGLNDGLELLDLVGRVIPYGWYDLEKLNYSLMLDALIKGGVDPAAKTVSPHMAMRSEFEVTRHTDSSAWKALLHHRLIANLLLLYYDQRPAKAAKAQTAADQAALACALERYRMANGQFPETLEALTPRFIARAPNDVITGQPYKYRRTDDGQFILYSVGWNEKDDGGLPGKTLFDQNQGDWVWSYPPK